MNQPPRILVVDDDPHIRYATSRVLRDAGYSVIEASSCDECLRLAREHAPDVILLDVVMDEPNGVETCKRIKADPALAHILVALLSGVKTDSESQALGLEACADEYIARPITHRELVARVQALVRLKQAHDALREQQRALLEKLERERATLDPWEQSPRATPSTITPAALVQRYTHVLHTRLQVGTNKELDRELHALAHELGQRGAGPREVIDLHIAALKNVMNSNLPTPIEVDIQESRLVALELMGYLVLYYRHRLATPSSRE
ncbi:MAG: response regulator [Anaerolineae bacterium]|nr:response regulator [Anaerolineae bacterium]